MHGVECSAEVDFFSELRRLLRWREEWMRDRALLRDLLLKTPQASPQELAQQIDRSVSWVKKWRKRLREGDPTDPRLLCSRSRAHHAPYFRLRCACGNSHCGHAP